MALHFPITADNRGFMSAIHEVTAGIEEATRQIEENGGSIDRVISMIKNGVASIGIGVGFKELIGQITDTRDQFQKLEITFKTFLGSEEEANKLMQQMVHTAAITPFDLAGVADGAKNLLAFGVAAEDVNKTIISLGDIAAGLSQPLGDIIYLYGTTISKPLMDTQDLMQMMGRGIPIAKELAKQFGVAENEVRNLISASKVTGEDVKKAFESMTGEGSMFGGLMEAQSKSIGGKIANIQDSIDEMFNEIGKSSEGIINATLDATGKIVENWQSVLVILADVAAAYGVEKAILAGTSAVATSAYGAEMTALRTLLPVKQESVNLDIQEALAKGKITEATASKVIAMRKEVESYMETLAAAKATATVEAQAAAEKYRAALKQSLAAKAALNAKREELIASGEICGAYISENAIKEMGIATDRAKEASIQSLAAKQEYHAAITKKKMAVDALETAQTNANTVANNLNARSTTILTVVKEGLRKATMKLYATMAAHPYALIAGAVLALGYGIYKLCTYESNAEKAMKAASDASSKAQVEMHKEVATLESLKKELDQSKKGTEQWKNAKDAIVSQFGKYFNGLDEEITKTGNLTSSYNELTKAIRLSAAARAMEKFRSENDNSNEIDEFMEGIRRDLSGKNFKVGADGEIDRTNGLQFVSVGGKLRDNIMQKVYEWLEDGDLSRFTAQELGYLNQTGAFSYHANSAGAKRIRQNMEQLKKGENLIAERYGTTVDEIDGRKPLDEDSDTTLKEAYESAKKAYEDQKALVAKMTADRASYSAKDYENAVSALKGLKAEFEKYGGQTKSKSGPSASQLASKEESAEGKIADLIRKQAEERLRLEQDYEYQRWQNRIDLMDDGEAKVLAQTRLNNEKELTELKRQEKAAEEAELQRQMALFNAEQDKLAAKDKTYAKKVFRDSDINQEEFDKIKERYESLYADLKASQQKAEQDRLDSSKESMNAYLKEFGNYQQKRIAIEEEYGKKISEAQDEGERMMLMAQRNKALSDLDYDEWVDTGAIALAFCDISKLSDTTIDKLIEDMERYREKVIATFDPDKIQKYEEALSSLRDAQSENTFGIFASAVPDYFKQRKSTSERMDSAGKNVIALEEQRVKLLEKINRLQDLIEVTGADGYDTSRLSAQLREANVELDANEKATLKAKTNFQQLQEEWDQLNTPEEKFYALCESIATASDLVGGLANQAADMADAIGADGLGDALGYLGDAMGSVSNIASGFANGGMIGGIAAAAGEIMGWVGKIFSAGDNRRQKNIERLQEQIDALNKSYEQLGSSIDKAYSTDASNLIDQQNTLLRQQQVLIRQQMAEEEAKKKTDDEKMKAYNEQLEEIDQILADNKQKAKEAIIGEDLKSAINEFASLYAEAWNDGTDAAQKSMAAVKNIISSALSEMLKKDIQPAAERFYDALAKAMEDGILTDQELDNLDALKRQIDALASASEEQYKMIQERYRDLDELKEDLTDISFDSVRDNFKSKLADMSSSAKDFSNDFSDMYRNALIDGLMDEKYDLMLREWYDEFAEAMNDKTLTDSERDTLRQQYDAIVQQGLADRDFINEIIGGGAYSQEATKGGWETMGQDQADELNGRFTALTELEAINNSLVAEGNIIATQILDTLRSLSSLSMVTDSENPTLREIRDMMFLSTGYLEDISKYTKQLITINSGIEKLNDLINKRL